MLAGVVDGDDVRVLPEPAGDLHLAAHARGARPAREQRERDLAVEPLVVGEVDLLGGAAPQRPQDPVATREQRGDRVPAPQRLIQRAAPVHGRAQSTPRGNTQRPAASLPP